MRHARLAVLPAAVLACAGNALAQTAVNEWLSRQSHVEEAVKATAGKKKPAQGQSISIDHGSTSFVDQSSAVDLLGAAMNLVPAGGSQDGSGTITASLYSVYALATRQDPLLPSVYNAHAGMRRLFFTAGREEQNSAASDPAAQGTVYGARWLPVNRRDASSIAQDPRAMEQFREIARTIARAAAGTTSGLETLLFKRFANGKSVTEFITRDLATADSIQRLVDRLNDEDRAQVDAMVKAYRDRMGAADSQLKKLVQILSRRWQVACDFQTTRRGKTANDDYQGQFIADRALTGRLFLAFNGGYVYSNWSKIGADTRSGRGAFELKYNVTEVGGLTLRSPLELAFSAESLRKQSQWQYHGQVQVVIPIATGVSLPVSFGYGNRPEVLRQQEKGVYGKFGLSFDFAKIVDALRANQ